MTDAIGMLEALSQWGEHLDALEAVAKEEKIVPGSFLGDYHATVMRMLRGIEALERARVVEMHETAETMRAAAKDGVEQARLELEKMEQARRKLDADVRLHQVKLEDAQLKVVQLLAEKVGEKVGEASVIRAKAYNRRQLTKMVTAGVMAVLLLLSVGFGLGRVSAMDASADETEQGN